MTTFLIVLCVIVCIIVWAYFEKTKDGYFDDRTIVLPGNKEQVSKCSIEQTNKETCGVLTATLSPKKKVAKKAVKKTTKKSK